MSSLSSYLFFSSYLSSLLLISPAPFKSPSFFYTPMKALFLLYAVFVAASLQILSDRLGEFYQGATRTLSRNLEVLESSYQSIKKSVREKVGSLLSRAQGKKEEEAEKKQEEEPEMTQDEFMKYLEELLAQMAKDGALQGGQEGQANSLGEAAEPVSAEPLPADADAKAPAEERAL